MVNRIWMLVVSAALGLAVVAVAGCEQQGAREEASDDAGAEAPASRSAASTPPPPPPPAPARKLPIGKTWTNSVGMTFAYVPAGSFQMGSPSSEAGRGYNEQQHPVRIARPFLMQTTEVTQTQWKAVMGKNPSWGKKGPDLPVQMVTWEDAAAFCQKLSEKEGRPYQLPTEAQWEYACRAGTSTAYYTGNSEQDAAAAGWMGTQPHPVGQKRANAWGLYDMHGNVWEWVQDRYGEYPTGSVTDPAGPASGEFRVYRGGAAILPAEYARSAKRNRGPTDAATGQIGFRVALTRLPAGTFD